MAVPRDKVLHFIAGFGLSLFGFWQVPLIFAGFLYAGWKEAYDAHRGGTVDSKDAVASAIGALLATILVLSVRLLILKDL